MRIVGEILAVLFMIPFAIGSVLFFSVTHIFDILTRARK